MRALRFERRLRVPEAGSGARLAQGRAQHLHLLRAAYDRRTRNQIGDVAGRPVEREEGVRRSLQVSPGGFAPRTPLHAHSRGPLGPAPFAWLARRARSRKPLHAHLRGPLGPAPFAWLARRARSRKPLHAHSRGPLAPLRSRGSLAALARGSPYTLTCGGPWAPLRSRGSLTPFARCCITRRKSHDAHIPYASRRPEHYRRHAGANDAPSRGDAVHCRLRLV